MLLWSVFFLLFSQSSAELYRTEFSKILKQEELARKYHEKYKVSADKIAQGYAAAARCISAGTYYNPYTKYTEFKEGTDQLDALIRKHPTEPELRYQRLLLQLFSPGFLGYNQNITDDLRMLCNTLDTYKACTDAYKLEMIRNLEPRLKETSQKLLLQQCKTALNS